MIHFRLMNQTDCHWVAGLLQRNAESQQGGLLGEYPLAKVEAMFAQALRVVIAEEENTLVGVVFSFPPQSASVSPVTQQIADQFNQLLENNWFYGPACINADYRGQGILGVLYAKLAEQNTGRPIAFINQDNIRSIHAHIKCGMQEVAQFNGNGITYLLMIGKPASQL